MTSAAANVSAYLKYADLQMAAEAFLTVGLTGEALAAKLVAGNGRSSRFTAKQAQEFGERYEVVALRENTPTGFSGTVFRNKQTGELTISFRSTEFIDDAVRDNEATNKAEIKAGGWAMGQISDMEVWYRELSTGSGVLAGKNFSVTGYSLGGHLATTFNILHQRESRITATYTFNGAGVGTIDGIDGNAGGTLLTTHLRRILEEFDNNRRDASATFYTTEASALYDELKGRVQNGNGPTADDMARAGALLHATDRVRMTTALNAIKDLIAANDHVRTLSSGVTGSAGPLRVENAAIAAMSLTYQLALRQAQSQTKPLSLVKEGINLVTDSRNVVNGTFANFHDIYGAPRPSAVANSQWHYGEPVGVFIEDQPLWRGTVIADSVVSSLKAWDLRLLVDKFGLNDFGDTHSLVLLVDSLNVQKLLCGLDPLLGQTMIDEILGKASNAKADSHLFPTGQGAAEGDVLENVIDGLRRFLCSPYGPRTPASMTGNTWANPEARATFYENLYVLRSAIEGLMEGIGRIAVFAASGRLAGQAREDFAALIGLLTLAPTALAADGPVAAELFENRLKSVWSDVHALWRQDQELSSAARAAGAENFTDRFLADRGRMLDLQAVRNAKNVQGQLGFTYTDLAAEAPTAYIDDFSGTKILVDRQPVQVPDSTSMRQVRFGDEKANSFTGYDQDDSLYGGGGNDVIQGLGGNDYIEGNVGNDRLDGGYGRDTLLGGIGNDVLTGGADNDVLKGGAGLDEYVFLSGWGRDFVQDSDGQGLLRLNGNVLTGADALLDAVGRWHSADGSVRYTEVDSGGGRRNLEIVVGGVDFITIVDWTMGQLGLTLSSAPVEQDPGRTFVGDFEKDLEDDDVTYKIGDDGNYVSRGQEADAQDIIQGTAGRDTIQGLGGNDALFGGAGDDSIDGGAGDDYLRGGAGRDTLWGGSGRDFIDASGVGRPLRPERNDYAMPVASAQEWTRGLGWTVDRVRNYSLVWGPQPSERVDSDAAKVIDGGAGDDYILAGTGDDVAHGGDDNDLIGGMHGNDVLYGDDGNDTLVGDNTVVPGPATVPAEAHGRDILDGGAGNDLLAGSGGDDTLYGGDDDDVLLGDDIALTTVPQDVHGVDFLDGGAGHDQLYGGGRADHLLGGTGNDRLWGDVGTSSVGSNDRLDAAYYGNDTLEGGKGNDTLWGEGGSDVLYGGEDADFLLGDDEEGNLEAAVHGNDLLSGEGGNDTLVGHGGADTLIGGTDNDVLFGDAEVAVLQAQHHGKDYLVGGHGNDTLIGGGADDVLSGGDGNDLMYGDDTQMSETQPELVGNDSLYGGVGDDYLFGGAGHDLLEGGEGSDQLTGGIGDDTLRGGAGADYMMGGKGNDVYQFSFDEIAMDGPMADTIEDRDGDNRIELVDADTTDMFLQRMGTDGDVVYAFGQSRGVIVRGAQRGAASQFSINGSSIGMDRLIGERLFETSVLSTATPAPSSGGGVAARTASIMSSEVITATESELPGVTVRGAALFGGALADFLTSADNASGTVISGGRGADQIRIVDQRGTTLRYSAGDGNDFIVVERLNSATSEDAPTTIEFASGISAADVSLRRGASGYLELVLLTTGESMTFAGLGGAPLDRVDAEVRFADGTVLSWDELEGLGTLREPGSPDGRTLIGTAGTDSLQGGGGSDVLQGRQGDDLLMGGSGNDLLFGGDGADTLDGGSGDDTLDGGAGADTIVFGQGRGNDVVVGRSDAADGVDIVQLDPSISYGDVWHDAWRMGLSTGEVLQIQGAVDVRFADGRVVHFGQSPAPSAQASPGDDFLTADAVGSLLSGGSGNDTLVGRAGMDSLHGGSGADSLRGGDGDDLLHGDAGADTLVGEGGHDVLLGGAGQDRLEGGWGDDTLDGGAGDDELEGGAGRDTYVFGRQSGHDRILVDATELTHGAKDRIVLEAGITPDQVTLAQAGGSITLAIRGSAAAISFRPSMWDGTPSIDGGIASIEFGDGTVWTASDIQQRANQPGQGSDEVWGTAGDDEYSAGAGDDTVGGWQGDDTLFGGAGNDSLFGGDGADVLDGGAGNDSLTGGNGTDTYVFNLGYGQDTLSSAGLTDGDLDTIRFGPGITLADLRFSRIYAVCSYDTLLIRIEGHGGDTLQVDDFYLMTLNRVGYFAFADGTVVSSDVIRTMPSEVAAWRVSIDGGIDGDLLEGSVDPEMLQGWDGDDTLDGAGGSDVIVGGRGQDVIRFGIGSGNDSVYGDLADRVVDVIEVGAGVGPADVSVRRVKTTNGWYTAERLVLTIDSTGDTLEVEDYFLRDDAVPGYAGELIRFADGTTWTVAGVVQRLPAPTDDSDVLTGLGGNDTLLGGLGRDTIHAGGGDDVIDGGDDNDYIMAGAGNDVVSGGAHDDQIWGGAGNDTLTGGSGDDWLDGGEGNDVYVFGRGHGHDHIALEQGDVIQLESGISPNDIVLAFIYSSDVAVTMRIADSEDSLTFSIDVAASTGQFRNVSIRFADGTVWDGATVKQRLFTQENPYVGPNATSDQLLGTDGDDHLTGGKGNDTLVGGEGRDELIDDSGSNVFFGGLGNDTIRAFGVGDIVDGGGGDDLIQGGQNTVFRFGRGDGRDFIASNGVGESGGTLVFKPGVAPGDLVLSRQILNDPRSYSSDSMGRYALEVRIGGTDDSVKISGFFWEAEGQPEGAVLSPVVRFQFDDGTVWTRDDVVAKVFAGTPGHDDVIGMRTDDHLQGGLGNDLLDGAGGSDLLEGGDGDDSLTGASGHDTLSGGNGNDRIDGSAGDDRLEGGAGADVYVFNVAGGHDRIAPGVGAAQDLLRFGPGITPENLVLVRHGDNLLISVVGTADRVEIESFFTAANAVERIEFHDGTPWDLTHMLAQVVDGSTNAAPMPVGELPGVELWESSYTSFSLPPDTFGDDDGTAELAWSARLGDGSRLPDWLWFDPQTRTFTGTAQPLPPGVDSIVVTVQDRAGHSASTSFAFGVVVQDQFLEGGNAADTLEGLSGNDTLRGLGGNDLLIGRAGNDSLDGGSGNDTMRGGAGDDTYVVNAALDVIVEENQAGTDTVMSSVSWTLGAHVENLVLTGASSLNATGNAAANTLTGNAGVNRLDGGAGADTMAGGAGNDTYVVDDVLDVLVEAASAGTDTVESSIDWTLGNNLEYLTLTGTLALAGYGNALNNLLRGNAAANLLDGGTGTDTLVGGAGDDTYIVNVTADAVTEAANEGIDTVQSSATFTLGNYVEHLVLTGTATIDGTGNSLDNRLTGNSANNRLTGNAGNDTLDGGLGNDALVGGAGDDTYVVDAAADAITEAAGAGTDTVQSSIGWTLATNLENLTLTGAVNVNGTGNTVANVLLGNAGANTLTGLAGNDTLDGGAGNDVLDGGAGADTYRFARGHGQDTVKDNDSTSGVKDRIEFAAGIVQSDLVFTKAGNHLVATVVGSTDQLTVQDWYLGTQYRVEEFRFADGSMLTDTQVQGLVSAMAAFGAPAAATTSGGVPTMRVPAQDLVASSYV